ncbi:MAG: adenylate/guanylate cyclase domain-containing protein [Verrucomicrobiota bacterium]
MNLPHPRRPARLALLTFLAVFASIVLVGLLVVPFLIHKMEQRYLLIQADINARQAKSLANFAGLRLEEGISSEEVARELQALLTGADAARGYSCVVERGNTEFICHPMSAAIGMSIATKQAGFVMMQNSDSTEPRPWEEAMSDGIFGAGSLFYPDGASEIVYMASVPETEWTVTTHENTQRVRTELETLRKNLIAGSLLIGLLLAIPSSLAARAVSRRHEKRIEAEQARSEKLLLNILPPAIAERLKNKEAVIADRHPTVTVLFADIVGFTPWAAKTPAEDLVARLNRIFSRFDDISAEHGLEKIKTIGDAYMLCGGIEGDPEKGARSVVAAGSDMIQALAEEGEEETGPSLSLRIGIHTGELVAGVIGKRKFSYDLWGDAVNTASRLESSGESARIQVSKATANLLGDDFEVGEERLISLKGIGDFPVAWVTRR